MITLLDRRELLTTFSLKEQAEVKDALAAEGIRYRTRTASHNACTKHFPVLDEF